MVILSLGHTRFFMKHYCWTWQADHTLQVSEILEETFSQIYPTQSNEPESPSTSFHIRFPDATIHLINKAVFIPFDGGNSGCNTTLFYNVSYLKSNLQKAVRRKQTDTALATASQLFHQSPNELLRRLPIIATEDAYWTHWTNHVVWIMCWYSKTKTLSNLHYAVVMGMVKQLCELDVAFDYRGMDKSKSLLNPQSPLADSFHLAVTIRQNYGGMGGDMHLLAFTKEKQGWMKCGDILSGNEIHIPTFSRQHMLLESIDFHCSNIMDGFKGEIPNSVLRKWIWEFRSGRNVRKPWTLMKPLPQWEEINKELDRLSREYWDKAEIVSIIHEPSSKRQRLITDFIKK